MRDALQYIREKTTALAKENCTIKENKTEITLLSSREETTAIIATEPGAHHGVFHVFSQLQNWTHWTITTS